MPYFETSQIPLAISQRRVVLLLASLFYAYAIHYAHVNYLSPAWDYYGFTYRSLGGLDVALIILLVLVGSAFVPTVLAKPSSIIVLLLLAVVYVPTVVLTLSLDTNRLERYAPSLLMLGLAFAIVCLGARCRFRRTLEPRMPGDGFAAVVFFLWLACCVVLVSNYYQVMSFAGVDQVYEQRAIGAATSLVMAYAQTYFSNVLSPALIAFGFVRKRWSLVVIGSMGCLLMYMIAAQKTVLLLPIAMAAVYFAMTSKWTIFRTSSGLLIALGSTSILSAAYYVDSIPASLFSVFLVFRTLGLPGLTFSQYYDVFSGNGFTWWSHVKGFDLLVARPDSYWTDTVWPKLGNMIGDRVYDDVGLNASANLFSGDGVAAAGPFGVIAIGLVLAIWLVLLDHTSKGWDKTFALLVTVPIALSLTNGHFFTTLLSFGGILWMLTFYLYKPGSRGREV